MGITLKLAVRDWDYIVPLALGDLRSPDFDLQIDRVGTLPGNLANDPRYDAGETSFSAYSLARASGDESLVGVPHFLMRAFRHRCIITAADSGLTSIEQLAGKRIGLTGWRDSGNTWTRAILRRAGIGIDDAEWLVGRLTDQHEITDRLNGFGRPGRIDAVPNERPMVELLASGELDAIFTPFMPPGFFAPSSGMRQLLPNCRDAEVSYFKEVGYVPGIHILGIKPGVVREHPWLPQALSELLDESARIWLQKREKYADTTPWIIDELRQTSQDLPATWNRNGFAENEAMILDFAAELHAQQLTPRRLSPSELFPHAV
ncbi:nitrate ABC transporter substrate-binding protein [Pandoraea terrae]|uniref:nitrate ABC transporter substrate-binding protein n=1 Tax=Pandoraea terrae TaxID=1537710 RepID=UPI001CD5CEEC|nr:nitrate ABC transporter substrate-binding protein [Pandoraea terrae]